MAARPPTPSAPLNAAGDAGNDKQPVREAPKLNPLQILGQLFDTNPNWLATESLEGCPFARSTTGTLYIADPPTVKQWMPQEWQLGTVTNWPDTIGRLLGAEALAVTRSAEQHGALRKVFGVMLQDSEVERMLPGIQATVERYMAGWAKQGRVRFYEEALTMVFDVLINQAMQLAWNEADIKKYAGIFETWNQGFTVVANPLPWSRFNRGMRARKELIARLRQSLSDPALTPGSMPAKLRDAYGADSDVCTDNLIMVVFAGFETTCSLVTGLLWHLSGKPEALQKLRAEQAQVAPAGAPLTLGALGAMPYTLGAIGEVLRLSQIVSGVPRLATKDLDLPRAPAIPSGCPLSVSWGGMSLHDPAVKGEETVFRPERWLDTTNAASLAEYQHPFGYGQHNCVGQRVARAIATAVVRELALKYTLEADAEDCFDNFPTGGRPRNGLPVTLKPRAPAQEREP